MSSLRVPRQNHGLSHNSNTTQGNRKSSTSQSLSETTGISSIDRVTRSSARLAVEPEISIDDTTIEPDPKSSAKSQTKSRKRKALTQPDTGPPSDIETSPSLPTTRKSKRQKITSSPSTPAALPPRLTRSSKKSDTQGLAMSSNGSSTRQHEDCSKTASSKSSSRGPFSRANKKSGADVSPPPQPAPGPRKLRKKNYKKDSDADMKDAEQNSKTPKAEKITTPPPRRGDSMDDLSPDAPTGDHSDPFASALFGRGGPSGLSNTLRALSGMMTGIASRFRDILNNLRRVEDPTMQMIALEELSNLLLVSNEDNLSGQFSPDPYVKELVVLMQPNPITGEENPETMLLACRCLANLMEALRGSVANVVYGGAVPVLCQKLLDIQYIDVAEQALSTLAKVSVDYPAAIVREGGLTACLQYLDFFATGTQRTAVTTAANCCRNIPHDSFPVIRDVMPILQSVLVSHDQKVVEQGCLCVTRIIDSFRYSPDKLEQLIDPPLLQAVLSLLLPGTTNLIGANIHTEFLRVLAIVAKNSPRLSAELLKLNVVDTLYQILTGVSPPSESEDIGANIDSVVIMQALVHRPREQIYEALNVICELLPRARVTGTSGDLSSDNASNHSSSSSEQRLMFLKDCKAQTRRFAMVLLPTLTDAYSSTVNLHVRQKVLTAQLKMLSNLDSEVIKDALKSVPYASFLASILSQEDHPSLVMFALQASELLFERLENIYRYQFYREGVISEIKKLAARASQLDAKIVSQTTGTESNNTISHQSSNSAVHISHEEDDDDDDDLDADDDDDEDDEDDDDDDERDEDIIVQGGEDIDDDASSESDREEIVEPLVVPEMQDRAVLRAKIFLEKYDIEAVRSMREKAESIRQELRVLATAIQSHYSGVSSDSNGHKLFEKLASYFEGDALESITSSELLDSGVIHLLGDVLADSDNIIGTARQDFLAAFMTRIKQAKLTTTTGSSASTAFTVLVHKLQDLLSRAEHFEVLTVNSNASEAGRNNSTSFLSRQIKLKLGADEDSNIPPTYRDMIVSIHAIATFKALDDYLRPRITLSERPSSGRRRDMLQQLANARMAQLSGAVDSGLFSPFGTELSSISASSSPQNASQSTTKTKAASSIPQEDNNKSEKPARRRSSRKQLVPESTDTPVPPASSDSDPKTGEASAQLEIVDEKHIVDEELSRDGEQDLSQLDAIVGEIEETASGDENDPDAVNMEIASSGRVTARREDGSRVYTPRQPGTPVSAHRKQTESAVGQTSTTSSQKRPSSHGILSQDWHIEFSIGGKPIPDNITIYRAIYHNREQTVDSTGRTVWTGIHEVKFRRVSGPAPVLKISNLEDITQDSKQDGLPTSLNGHPITASILTLLGILHDLNANLTDTKDLTIKLGSDLHPEPLASFLNTKLTAKMNRQLEEPLIVASNCLPDWSEDLARSFPFLFPFETRHLFLQSTSFGYSRSITRWQSTQENGDDRRDRRRDDRPLMGRPQRQKVRIARTKMLESAMKVMDHFGASPSILEVEYFDEVGTGLGPTLEFYSTVSKEFAKKQLKLWRENDTDAGDQYAFGKGGLFPSPMDEEYEKTDKGKKIIHAFRMLGVFVARSMLDSRIIDVDFSPTFFRLANGSDPSISLLRTIDEGLANSMSQLKTYADRRTAIQADESLSEGQKASAITNLTIRGASLEDLGLDFTLPGYPHINMIDNGSDIEVTNENLDLYIQKVLDFSLGKGVRSQINAFRGGFSQVFPYNSLKAFTPNELVMLFGHADEDWSIETLMDSIKADHGFNMDSKSVKNLLQVMSEFTAPQQRDFLQFVTGSPRLPIGGFKSLTPMFTVVCKPSEPPYTSDEYLPSVMTCANYLKLPDYSNVRVLKDKLGTAIREGQGAFHLS